MDVRGESNRLVGSSSWQAAGTGTALGVLHAAWVTVMDEYHCRALGVPEDSRMGFQWEGVARGPEWQELQHGMEFLPANVWQGEHIRCMQP